MAYFEDLSPYAYFREEIPKELNVGWLDVNRDFSTGKVSIHLIRRLESISHYSVNQTRGRHFCKICGSVDAILYDTASKKLVLGDAEIRVFCPSGDIYAAPNMLLHYIIVHDYLPPPSFLQAVEKSPVPPHQDYFDLLRAQNYEWSETTTRDGPVERRPPLAPPSWLTKRRDVS